MTCRRDGYALVAALWFLVLISALSLEAAHTARGQRLIAAGLSESAQARTAAAAGVEHARARLAARAVSDMAAADAGVDPWAAAVSTPADTVALGAARYAVAIHDVNARININRADDEQLRRLLLALRLDARVAGRITDALLDWRDADTDRRVNGAERAEYLRAARARLPRDAPFDDVAELEHVLGMDAVLFARIAPHVTTEGSGRINLNAASVPVLASLPGVSGEAVAVIVRRRASGRPLSGAAELQLELSPEARALLQRDLGRFLAMALFDTREVEAVSTGWVDGSPVRVTARAVLARGGAGAIMTGRRTE